MEGAARPLELVPADFLQYLVEAVLRKFFRIMRSERTTGTADHISIRDPADAAMFLESLLGQLSYDLSDHPSRFVEESHFRMRVARDITIIQKNPAAKVSDAKSPSATQKPCAGHLGKQLGAKTEDGKVYKCSYGKECKFRHVSEKGKSKAQILAVVSTLPPTAQKDLTKALKSRP